jgi:hypothetical protein
MQTSGKAACLGLWVAALSWAGGAISALPGECAGLICTTERECYPVVYECGYNPDGTVIFCSTIECEMVERCRPRPCTARPSLPEIRLPIELPLPPRSGVPGIPGGAVRPFR